MKNSYILLRDEMSLMDAIFIVPVCQYYMVWKENKITVDFF